MSKKQPKKPEEPAPGFNDLVKKLLDTPPAPKKAAKKRGRKGKE